MLSSPEDDIATGSASAGEPRGATRVDLLLSRVRLAIFALSVAVLVGAAWAISPIWLLLPVVAFVAAGDRQIASSAAPASPLGQSRSMRAAWRGGSMTAGLAPAAGDRFADDAHLMRATSTCLVTARCSSCSRLPEQGGEQSLRMAQGAAARDEIWRATTPSAAGAGADLREAIAISGDEIRQRRRPWCADGGEAARPDPDMARLAARDDGDRRDDGVLC